NATRLAEVTARGRAGWRNGSCNNESRRFGGTRRRSLTDGERDPDSTVVRRGSLARRNLRVLAADRGLPALHGTRRVRRADRRETLALGDRRAGGTDHDV